MAADFCAESNDERAVPVVAMLTMRVDQSVETSPQPAMVVGVGEATQSQGRPIIEHFGLVLSGAVGDGSYSCCFVAMPSAGRSPDVAEGVAKVVERPSTVLMSVWLSLVTPAPLLGMALENRSKSLVRTQRHVRRRPGVAKP